MLSRIKANHHYDINPHGTDYFVGDIHGHFDLLMEQLNRCSFNFSRDRLFAVGDIIDRGLSSEKCIDLLIEPWFFSCLGNHEQLFLQGFEDEKYWQILVRNGGQWVENWQSEPHKLMAWAHLIRIKMPLTLTVETIFGSIGVSHADAPLNWRDIYNSKALDLTEILWRRQSFQPQNKQPIKHIDKTFHGHNQISSIKTINNQIWADTVQKTSRLSILSAKQIFTEF